MPRSAEVPASRRSAGPLIPGSRGPCLPRYRVVHPLRPLEPARQNGPSHRAALRDHRRARESAEGRSGPREVAQCHAPIVCNAPDLLLVCYFATARARGFGSFTMRAGQWPALARNDPLHIFGGQRQQTLLIAASECCKKILHDFDILLCAHRNLLFPDISAYPTESSILE